MLSWNQLWIVVLVHFLIKCLQPFLIYVLTQNTCITFLTSGNPFPRVFCCLLARCRCFLILIFFFEVSISSQCIVSLVVFPQCSGELADWKQGGTGNSEKWVQLLCCPWDSEPGERAAFSNLCKISGFLDGAGDQQFSKSVCGSVGHWAELVSRVSTSSSTLQSRSILQWLPGTFVKLLLFGSQRKWWGGSFSLVLRRNKTQQNMSERTSYMALCLLAH